jgi:hypothetical protein
MFRKIGKMNPCTVALKPGGKKRTAGNREMKVLRFRREILKVSVEGFVVF